MSDDPNNESKNKQMMNPILKFSLPLIMVISVSCTEDPEKKNAEEQVTGHVFPIGESFTSENFTGTAWLEMLVEDDGTLDTHIGNVTFEPGARTNWHYHPGGQILLATYGTGYYQEKGQPIQILQKGDAVKCPPDVEHWHGASPDSKFTHVAIGPNLDRGGVVWLDPVTDEEYNQPNEPQQNRETEDYQVGNPLGLPVNPSAEDMFEEISPNVKVYGAIFSAESCSYDEERDLIVVPNRGVPQNVQTNDAWLSLINHDGSVHTAKWIGVQNPADRENLSPPLVLNEPLGSHITDGILYLADRDGETGPDDPGVGVIRMFDMETGEPAGKVTVDGSNWLNDLTVAEDGTIYTTQTGDFGEDADPDTWRVWKISPDREVSLFLQNEPLRMPNGIDFDLEGNIVVANYGNDEVLTFSPDGELLKTEQAVQPGGDGIAIMSDGTKYVSSVMEGGISRIREGEPAELIAENIPSAASLCYDAGAHQLVVLMNPNNGLAFVPLD